MVSTAGSNGFFDALKSTAQSMGNVDSPSHQSPETLSCSLIGAKHSCLHCIPAVDPTLTKFHIQSTKLTTCSPSPIKGVYPPELVYPKSLYQAFGTSASQNSSEESAIAELCEEHNRLREGSQSDGFLETGTFIEFKLVDFSIYLPGTNAYHPFELRSLHALATRNHTKFLLDGILSFGDVQKYVKGVPFELCSIGNYGLDDLDSSKAEVWIQSDLNVRSKIFYRRRTPSLEYTRFHEAFLWIARLSNLLFAYAQHRPTLSVHSFHSDFHQWATQKYGHFKQFRAWIAKFGSEDFRGHISTNIDFFYHELVGLDWNLHKLAIWGELRDAKAIPYQQIKALETIVTPFVYDLWSHLPFGHLLKAVAPEQSKAAHSRNQHKTTVHVANYSSANISDSSSAEAAFVFSRPDLKTIRIGDVLAVTKEPQSVWRDEISRWKLAQDDCWYICVSTISVNTMGFRTFDGNWLYRPSDTSCAKMKYPYHNELFISNNCTCRSNSIAEEEILAVVPIVWRDMPVDTSVKFCRQSYLDNERFVTFRDEHKFCVHMNVQHNAARTSEYFPGQTVLSPSPRSKSYDVLEPYEVIRYLDEGSNRRVVLRELLRRDLLEHANHCRPNELVYTDHFDVVPSDEVRRACLVRFYPESDVVKGLIPSPYNQDGTGSAFYITKRLVRANGVLELLPIHESLPRSLIQGFDPCEISSKATLRGLDLFSGWGSFGRGLEEGGVLKNRWAVDLYDAAIHAYHANLRDPDETKLFFGSVNDMLHQAMSANPKSSTLIPARGEVDFISAGSPCQGFSQLNNRKHDEKSLRNQSLVASVAAFVDFYRPKYGILENVVSISNQNRDQDVLSQLICSLVGMGYQVQEPFLLEAWNHGSAQSRSRLFICFAAPGLEPMVQPEQSHSHHPQQAGKSRAIGKLANGAAFGERHHGPTPFRYLTARNVCADLPATDGACMHIRHPDHVPARVLTERHRQQIAVIPKRPRGMTFIKAWDEGNGVMTSAERSLFPASGANKKSEACTAKHSKAWGRIHPEQLFKTVIVSQRCEDSRMGTVLHWQQDRELTILEVRRAQSVPDYEVLVGTPAARWKLIGNGVDRKVALVLGLSLREAWLRSRPGNEDLNITDGYTDDRAAVYFAKTANPPTKINISVPVKDDYGEDSEDELASTLDIPNIFSSRSITKSTSSTTESTGGDEIVKGHKRHRIEMPGHMSMKRSKHQKHHID